MKEWKLFSPQGKLYKTLDVVSNFFIWNILWIVCSIPLITVGATTCALYDMNLKSIRKETCHFTDYFKSFKENFWFGIGCEVLGVILGALCFGGIKLIERIQISEVFVVLFYVGMLLVVAIGSYVLPTRVCFFGTWKDILKFSVYLCLKMPFYFLLKIMILIFPIFLEYLFYHFFMMRLVPLVLLFGFSISNYLNLLLYMKIIARQGYKKSF